MKVLRDIEIAVEEGIEEMVFDRYRYRGGGAFSIYPPGIEKLLRLRYEKA